MKTFFSYFSFILISVVVFYPWFFSGTIASGDFGYLYPSMYENYSWYPYVWFWNQNYGLGGFMAPFLWILATSGFPVLVFGQIFQLPWAIVQKLGYLFPLLILPFFSSFYLFRKLFPRNPFFLFAPFFYIFNTYYLMLVGGGQVLFALSYALFPFTMKFFIDLHEDILKKNIVVNKIFLSTLLAGFFLTLQILFDTRIAYVSLVIIFFYWIFKLFWEGKQIIWSRGVLSLFIIFVGTGIIAFLLNTFWLLPTIFAKQDPLVQLGTAYTVKDIVSFLSFARLEHTLSLLHPNWPENIFGKVGFMKSEFLVLPIFAFSSLLFIVREKKRESFLILFFVFIGLVGAFLAKGTNDPFGSVYLWFFDYFPGFKLFRDASKWYILIAISYSILIPFTISKIYELLRNKLRKRMLSGIFLVLIIGLFSFLIHPALTGKLTGTFKPIAVPNEYQELERFLSSDKQFSRVLWMPVLHRFGYYSEYHPSFQSKDFFNAASVSAVLPFIEKKDTRQLFVESAIKYVVVPADSQREIYLTNEKYDKNLYQSFVTILDQTDWLTRSKQFGDIIVYEVSDPKPHFWIQSTMGEKSVVDYTMINPSTYHVSVAGINQGDLLIFSESFTDEWRIRIFQDKQENKGNRYHTYFTSFMLPKEGTYTVEIFHSLQRWADIGFYISIGSGIILFGTFIILLVQKKKTS